MQRGSKHLIRIEDVYGIEKEDATSKKFNMVRSVDANQFNTKLNMKSQDLTRSTQAGKIKMGTTKKTTIDKGLVSGASTFGDYQKATATATTGVKKTSTTSSTVSKGTTSDSTTKSSSGKDALAKGSTTGKSGEDTKEKPTKNEKESSLGTGSKTSVKKTTSGTTGTSSGVKKGWGSSVAKTGMSNVKADHHTVEEQDEEDGDGGEEEVESTDKKLKPTTQDPSMGINIYSMGIGAKGMFNAGKK